ncbi:MAG TPA: helix-turn-helix domain-containing protein [Solirubrobacteraceae bacterium]|nr:helix-turn-helix domain-containing protein [Solirubrobacteraceae bacterium]
MRIDDLLTDAALLAELGRRLALHRLQRDWTQAELAARAGVGKATVQRAERGESVQMSSMVRLWRALELLPGLDAAVPESIELPIARLAREQRRTRARATGSRARRPAAGTPEEQPWRWGDEPADPDDPDPPDARR